MTWEENLLDVVYTYLHNVYKHRINFNFLKKCVALALTSFLYILSWKIFCSTQMRKEGLTSHIEICSMYLTFHEPFEILIIASTVYFDFLCA